MIYNDVSLALRNKIRRDMNIIHSAVDDERGIIRVYSTDEQYLIDECREWLGVIKTYFKTTYDCYKLAKVGRFYGVRPLRVYHSFSVFHVDSHDPPSWEDWFDLSGKNDGPLLGQIGIVKNERSEKRVKEFLKYC